MAWYDEPWSGEDEGEDPYYQHSTELHAYELVEAELSVLDAVALAEVPVLA